MTTHLHDPNARRANSPAMSRRTILTALPATGVALALPCAAATQPPDPFPALYRDWLDARRTWRELANLPDNGNWDSPETLDAERRENEAEDKMLELNPQTPEAIAALVALAWVYVGPGATDPEEYARQAQSIECRAVMAIWRACTGRDDYPAT